MSIKGLNSHYNDYPVKMHGLTEGECEQIIEAALEVIENVGMKVTHQRSVELMIAAGCRYEEPIMYVPRELVLKSIQTVPNHVDLYDRLGNHRLRVGGSNSYFGTGPTNPFVNEFETNERRASRVQDVADQARVSDACKNIDFVYNLADPEDCPKAINDVYSMRAMLNNTVKPIICLAVDVDSLAEQFEMVLALYNGDWDAYRAKPCAMCMPLSPVSPLSMPNDADMEKMFFCCEHGIPMIFANAVQPGMSAPVTPAGAMAVSLAEQFFGIVLSQLINEGCPYVAQHFLYTVDMNTMIPCYGTPEHCIGDIVGPDIFRYLDIPLETTAGGSEAKIVDEQYAYETAFTVYSTVMSGGQLVHDIGFMDSALTSHLDSITISDEIIGFARHIAKGMEVNEETLALDVIREVGPGGNYMVEEHTIENYRDLTWFPWMAERGSYSSWHNQGEKDMRTKVHERTRWILENHKVVPLSKEVADQIDMVIERANARVAGK